MREKTKYLIVGGGLSGLIMGLELTKRGEDYIIIEKNGNPVEAKLHYLHADISKYFPFKLREVDIATNWLDNTGKLRADRPSIDVMNNFSWITTDKVFQNSMKFIDGVLHKGWIPETGIENISEMVRQFNKNKPLIGCELLDVDGNIATVRHGDEKEEEILEIEFDKIISTIPLPFMMKIVGNGSDQEFKTEPLKMTEVIFEDKYYEDLFQIVYLPYADYGYSRISILGNRIVAEKANGQFEAGEEGNRIGLKKLIKMLLPNCDVSKAKFEDMTNWYGRYIPIDEGVRGQIMRSLESKNILCLGRYAEWTYMRVDHVVKKAELLAESFTTKKGEI